MNKTKGFVLAAAVAAMAFTFSCSSGDDGGDDPSSSSGGTQGGGGSSPGGGSSSSLGGGGQSSSSIAQGGSSSSFALQCLGGDSGTFPDSRDNKEYRYVTICTQTWMAENLNYEAEGSKCYGDRTGGDSLGNCAIYGRLYDWYTAQTVCPSGWHLPNNAEWDRLYHYVDGTSVARSPYESLTAGKYLKSASGWNNCGPSGSGSLYLCEDTYGFAALPGGEYEVDNSKTAGDFGRWWSASELNVDYAYNRGMTYSSEHGFWNGYDRGRYLFSVRCVKD